MLKSFLNRDFPIFLIEHFNKKKNKNKKKSTHICFMVHGLNGTKNDLRNLGSILKYHCKETIFVYAEENQYKTDQSIQTQGNRLYQEICLRVLQLKKDEERMQDIRISFIAHSMGGLVVREALT